MAAAVNALNSLLRGTSIDDHEEALKLANAAIGNANGKASPEQLTALHAKVVALLKLDRFDDALRTVAAGGDALAARTVLERAYALYKTGDLEAAAELAASSSKTKTANNRALKHVAAQVAYRAEQFDLAAGLYSGLAEDADSAEDAAVGESTDVRINALATSAQRAWQGRGSTTVSAGQDAALDAGRREDLESFEMAYNAGCTAVARGDVGKASILLRRAQQLCEASDELSDEDKSAEMLPILIQQAYTLTRLGRHEDAAKLQQAIDASESEGSAKVVLSANSVVLKNTTSNNTSTNPYVVQRQIDAIPTPPTGSDRLFAHQARILRRNQYAIELQCYKFKGVLSRTAKQLKRQNATDGDDSDKENEGAASTATSPDTVDLGIFGAAAKAELQTGKEALRRILPLLEHRPDDVGLVLTAVQLQLQAHNAEAALSLLEAFFRRSEASAAASAKDARFAPGLVALAVAIYKLQGRHHAVRTELAKAVTHWQESSKAASSAPPASLLRAAGVELLHSQDPTDQAAAASAFEKLHAADPADKIAAAGLVASLAAASSTDSTTTPAQSARQQKLAASLTPVDQLVKGIDVNSLLQGGVATLATPAAPTKSKKRSADADATATAADAAQPSAKKTKTGAAGGAAAKLSRQARKLQAKAAEEGSTVTFDANKKMDPERWLPVRDRSSYRPPKGKKGRGRRGEAALTQGGVVKEEETLALAGGAGSVKVEKAPQGPSGNAAAKKRKKGKK